MRPSVDKKADALYLRLDDSDVVESVEITPGVVCDFNHAAEVVGVEMLRLSTRLASLDLLASQFEALGGSAARAWRALADALESSLAQTEAGSRAGCVHSQGQQMRRVYPSYRDSGVEWLGEVPTHWGVRRLEHVASYRTSSVDKKTEDGELPIRLCNYTDVYYQDRIRVSDGGFMEATASPAEIARFGLNEGDILITKDSEDWCDIGVPALVSQSAKDFVCGYHLGIVRLGELTNPEFMFRAMQSLSVNRQLQISATGVTRYGLPKAAVCEALIPLPPLDEQRAIAAFLARETGTVDELVMKKRLLIERLDEYRNALISRTVTRGLPPDAAHTAGLDPSPRLKASGVDWLGEVPAHWKVRRVEHVASYRTSSVDKKTEDGELPIRLCNYTDVYYRDRIRASDGDFMKATASPSEVSRFRLSQGDVLITRDSEDWRDIAVPALIDESAEDFVCGYHLGIITPSELTDPEFMFRVMQSLSVNQQLQTSATGVTRYGLPNAAVGEMLIPLPPIKEQQAIASFIRHKLDRIRALASRVATAIERLEEYRTALITAAVTGKIDVRDGD